MSRKSIDGDHFTTDFYDLRFSVDEHRHFTKAFLQASAEGPFSLVADETKRIPFFVGPVLEILHHGAAVEHSRGRQDDARRTVHHDAFSKFTAFHRSEPFACEGVGTVVLKQGFRKSFCEVIWMRRMDGRC